MDAFPLVLPKTRRGQRKSRGRFKTASKGNARSGAGNMNIPWITGANLEGPLHRATHRARAAPVSDTRDATGRAYSAPKRRPAVRNDLTANKLTRCVTLRKSIRCWTAIPDFSDNETINLGVRLYRILTSLRFPSAFSWPVR